MYVICCKSIGDYRKIHLIPGKLAFVCSQTIIKDSSRKRLDRKFAEITQIFIRKISLRPKKCLQNILHFFVHVYIIIILKLMKQNHTFFCKVLIKHFFLN